MKLTILRYDFDNDGFISPEDVRIILSHIPLLNNEGVTTGPAEGQITMEGRGL